MDNPPNPPAPPANSPAPPAPPAPPPGPDPELLQLRLENARLKVLGDFPQADPELLAEATSPEQVVRFAEMSHKRALAAQQQIQQQADEAAQRAREGNGNPQPPTNDVNASDPDEVQRRTMRMKLRSTNQRRRLTVDEVLPFSGTKEEPGDFFIAAWNRHMLHRKQGHGDF